MSWSCWLAFGPWSSAALAGAAVPSRAGSGCGSGGGWASAGETAVGDGGGRAGCLGERGGGELVQDRPELRSAAPLRVEVGLQRLGGAGTGFQQAGQVLHGGDEVAAGLAGRAVEVEGAQRVDCCPDGVHVVASLVAEQPGAAVVVNEIAVCPQDALVTVGRGPQPGVRVGDG
jgi:hypothetical protein